jgi:cytochrome c biogenesis protein CcdA
MVKKFGALILFVVLLSSFALADQEDCLYYFTGDGEGCPECSTTRNLIERLESKYPSLHVNEFEVYRNISNRDTLEEYFIAYNVPAASRGIPAVFMPGTYIIGQGSLTELLDGRIQENDIIACPALEDTNVIGIVGKKSPFNVFDTLSFQILTLGALRDSVSVCALALLLILLSLALAVKDQRALVRTGSAFLIAVFFSYILYGIGLFSGWKSTGIYFPKIAGALAIILGIIKIKRFFWTAKPLKEMFEKIIKYTTSTLGTFIIGILAAIFASPCLGTRFLIITELIAYPTTRTAALPLLFYYAIIVMLPLVILLFVMYKSFCKLHQHAEKKGEKKIEKWQDHFTRLIHLIIGVVLVMLGLILLLI